MPWFRLTIVAGLLAAWGAGEVRADWWSVWTDACRRDYRRNTCWPQPFIRPDREAVKQPIWCMIDNGWRRQNLVGDHYFTADSVALNEAGVLKIRWIMTQAPTARRTIFVERGMDPEQTAARIDAVQQAAAKLAPGELPEVIETGLASYGWPADYIESVDQKFRATAPAPRIPQIDRDGGGQN
jgi:hypothetical protein